MSVGEGGPGKEKSLPNICQKRLVLSFHPKCLMESGEENDDGDGRP